MRRILIIFSQMIDSDHNSRCCNFEIITSGYDFYEIFRTGRPQFEVVIIECFGANGAISWSSPGHEIWVRVCFPFLFDHKISQRSLNRLSLNLQEWWIVIISRGFFHFFKMHFLLSVSCPATINSSFTFAKCVARMQKKIRMFLQHIKQFLYITNFLIQDIDM